jgi:hypothetical protein
MNEGETNTGGNTTRNKKIQKELKKVINDKNKRRQK